MDDKYIDDIRKWLDSDDGKEAIKELREQINLEKEVEQRNIDKLHRHYSNELIDKIINHYTSDKYRDRWWKRGFEPPEDLFYLLFEHSKKYGKKVTKKELKKYGTMFLAEMYKYGDYAFGLHIGQGSFISINKITF